MRALCRLGQAKRRPNKPRSKLGLRYRSTQPTLAALVFLLMVLAPAHAVEPGEMLKDAALEARARRISQELRCVVCQNQSIDDSTAPLAHDLRVIVRERLVAGDSDAQVLAFVEARYGEFVLLRPHLEPQTLLLWTTPLLLLAGAAAYLLRARSRAAGGRQDAAPLSPEEQRRLEELMRADKS
jgi:cytochrome c-type biogenesis protein CcmH